MSFLVYQHDYSSVEKREERELFLPVALILAKVFHS